MMSHLDDGLINELLDGEIPSSDLAPIQAHLSECLACRTRLEVARELANEAVDLIEALDEPIAVVHSAVIPIASRRRTTNWTRTLAWAASLIVAVGLGYSAGGRISLGPLSQDSVTATVRGSDVEPVAATPIVRNAAPPQSVANQPSAGEVANRAARVTQPTQVAPTESRELVAADETSNKALEDAALVTAQRPAPAALAEAARRESAQREAETALSSAGRGFSAGAGPERARAAAPLIARDQRNSLAATKADTISLPDAMRLLGGSLRLVEGLVPLQLEAMGTEVRVIYPLAVGTLVLNQRLVGESITWELTAPAGFPADSLRVLRSKVR
jgi:predicted anti-sigma-YlaC factor YlaD